VAPRGGNLGCDPPPGAKLAGCDGIPSDVLKGFPTFPPGAVDAGRLGREVPSNVAGSKEDAIGVDESGGLFCSDDLNWSDRLSSDLIWSGRLGSILLGSGRIESDRLGSDRFIVSRFTSCPISFSEFLVILLSVLADTGCGVLTEPALHKPEFRELARGGRFGTFASSLTRRGLKEVEGAKDLPG